MFLAGEYASKKIAFGLGHWPADGLPGKVGKITGMHVPATSGLHHY
jgi:hypothetical protein